MINHLAYNDLTRQRDLAAQTIGVSANIYEKTATYARMFRYRKLHPSFVNNLKDSIIHFQKLDAEYSSIDQNAKDVGDSNLAVFMQFELMSEHMTRGIIDTFVEMLQHAAKFYETFLRCLQWEINRGTIQRADAFIKLIRMSMHFCKDSVLELRTSKMDLIRIAKNQPIGLNVKFISCLNKIRTDVRQNYEAVQSHLHNDFINHIYDMVMKACEHGYSLHRVKEGDTMADVAAETGCETSHIRKMNSLATNDFGTLPKAVTWIFY